MTVIGIDFGNDNCVIGNLKRGGVDIVLNEVSNRATPTFVSYGEKERFIGESGLNQQIKNSKNTISQIKRVLGLKYSSPEFQKEAPFLTSKTKQGENDSILFQVNYRNEVCEFTPEQIAAALFGKLKAFAEADQGVRVVDCVISVPPYYTDAQRRALHDAATIAGLNPLRLFDEGAAAALDYGIYKTDLPEKDPQYVVFVDLGHSATSASVAAFNKGKVAMLSTAFDRHLGTRDFDLALTNHFVEQVKAQYKMDVRTNPKSFLRLYASCEKLKKVLSANPVAPLNVESLMDDRDVRFQIQRAEFEEMVKPLLERIVAPVRRAIEDSGIALDKIHSIELIGGGSRIPSIKTALREYFGRDLSTTLHTTEAIARGSAVHAAMLSPSFKVREFKVEVATPFAVSVNWETPNGGKMDTDDATAKKAGKTVVIEKGEKLPTTKLLTFMRTDDFDVIAKYEESDLLPAELDPVIARIHIEKPAGFRGTEHKIKLKVRSNQSGIFQVENAHVHEEVEEVEQPAAAPAAPAEGEQATPAEPKKKLHVKRTDCKVTVLAAELTKAQMQAFVEAEVAMQTEDRVVTETRDAKNAVESFLYDARSKVSSGGSLADYTTDAERSTIVKLSEETEDWLYGDGEDTTKSVYAERLKQLTTLTDPITVRQREAEERPAAVKALNDAIANYTAAATSTDDTYSHIEQSEKDKITAATSEAQKWLSGLVEKQALLPKTAQPVVLVAEINKKREAIEKLSNPILSKPKPAPPKPEPPKAEEKPQPSQEQTPMQEEPKTTTEEPQMETCE